MFTHPCWKTIVSFTSIHNAKVKQYTKFKLQLDRVSLLHFQRESFLEVPLCHCRAEVAMDPEFRSRLRQDSAFFYRIRIRSQKFLKNRTRIKCQLFNFGGSRSLLSHFLSKNTGKFSVGSVEAAV